MNYILPRPIRGNNTVIMGLNIEGGFCRRGAQCPYDHGQNFVEGPPAPLIARPCLKLLLCCISCISSFVIDSCCHATRQSALTAAAGSFDAMVPDTSFKLSIKLFLNQAMLQNAMRMQLLQQPRLDGVYHV